MCAGFFFLSFLWSSMVSMSGEVATCKSEATVVTDHFPVGLRVLVVDDDVVCLRIIEQMLRRCKYSGLFPSTTSFLLWCFNLCTTLLEFHLPVCQLMTASMKIICVNLDR